MYLKKKDGRKVSSREFNRASRQGVQQGLLEGIEALLEIKFGERGLEIGP